MATFGYSDLTGAFSFSFIANEKRAFKFAMLEGGDITKLSIYLGGGAVANHITGLVYADSAGAPAAKLKEGDEITVAISQALGWVDLTFATPLTVASARDLWLGYIIESSNGSARYVNVGTQAVNGDTYAGGATDPFGSTGADPTHQFLIYATYTPATGSVPANTSLPTITGTAAVGATLTGTLGGWTGAVSYATQWKRDAVTISGATSSTYVVQAGDAGHTLTCEVTATNATGSTVATSAGLAIPAAFALVTPPTFTGTLTVGSTQTVAAGTYSPTPSSLTYQWYRSIDNQVSFQPIAGAIATTYVLTAADAPNGVTYITVDETATA
jgi:hypothetical protein